MKNPQKIKESQRLYRLKRRLKILQHYSAEIPFCACCKEKEIKFLSIDHINGGGTKHRQQLQTSVLKPAGGSVMYGWIIKNNYPEGFQILCHNCNQAKGFYGTCPHQEK